ncbi:MINDY4B family protein [Megaselia abdita]
MRLLNLHKGFPILSCFYSFHPFQFIGESGPGCMLFLYSAVLTRTISKVRTDLDNSLQYLTGTFEEGSLNVVTLLLTGRATPHLHNGVIHVGDEDNYALPQYGILNRCPVGLLIYENEKRVEAQKQPGSRLKTPNLPIWIGSCMGYFGVLFNTNADLLRNYHAESRFELFYYSMSGTQVSMTIDNSTYHDQAAGMLLRAPSGSEGFSTSRRNSDVDEKDESTSSPLQKLVHTKWQESSVKFHDDPQVMSTLFCPF